jgi:hypothetical protein
LSWSYIIDIRRTIESKQEEAKLSSQSLQGRVTCQFLFAIPSTISQSISFFPTIKHILTCSISSNVLNSTVSPQDALEEPLSLKGKPNLNFKFLMAKNFRNYINHHPLNFYSPESMPFLLYQFHHFQLTNFLYYFKLHRRLELAFMVSQF